MTPCATKASSTGSASCRPGCRWSSTSSPARSTVRHWWLSAAVSRRAQQESTAVLRRALGIDYRQAALGTIGDFGVPALESAFHRER